MNPWPFVIAAYGLTAVGVFSVSITSWRAMRRAEEQASQMAGRRSDRD